MFFRKTLDIITLFHKANAPAPAPLVNLLKQAATNASQAANEAPSVGAPDSAPTSAAAPTTREPFDLDITDQLPTQDQVETILGYVKPNEISQVVSGANSVADAMRRFKMDKDTLKTPLVVDWSGGKVVPGGEESKVLQLLQATKE
ncbi:hypothetical protein VUR80DRAFT_7427 [Thermomyces stellatus]